MRRGQVYRLDGETGKTERQRQHCRVKSVCFSYPMKDLGKKRWT